MIIPGREILCQGVQQFSVWCHCEPFFGEAVPWQARRLLRRQRTPPRNDKMRIAAGCSQSQKKGVDEVREAGCSALYLSLMDFLSDLNPQQRQAVTVGLGPILVMAGPGSGKTRVLTQRIAYLIGQMGVRPYQILAVTFTNKAAREMESRVVDLLGERAHGVMLGTFHASCARILRREAEHLPFNANFVIFDADDQEKLVKQAIADLDLDEKKHRPQAIHASISKAKNELILPDSFPTQTYRDEVVKKVYIRYQQLLLTSNGVDFDDLLLYTANLLEEQTAVREKYARRFEHVLVDEFQDTNMAQYVLLKHLSSFHGNIFVVGDVDQCLPSGTLIQTPLGVKPIETIQPGEQVVAAAGRGASMSASVQEVGKRDFTGDLFKVVTRKGFSFLATPGHIVFARLGINPDVGYPPYIPKAKLHRHTINLRYFGDGRRSATTPWNAHRIDVRGSDPELMRMLEARDYPVRRGKRQTWRVGFSRLHFDDAQTLAKELGQLGDGLDIVAEAFLTKAEAASLPPCFSLMPVSHLHPTMFVAVEQGGQIVQDEIVEVTPIPYRGLVYDLEVDEVHNYLAGGVVVHNSIYRWRGADYRNVRRFEEDYPQAQVILLEQNYRSTQSILDVAMAIIDRNSHRVRKQLYTERGRGEKIVLHETYDDREEAFYVVDTIASLIATREAQPGDFAVMYRTNAQSRLLEEAFLHANMPVKLVGAQRFYGRREVKDLIAYLRLVHNPNDEISLTRVINVPPRAIGEKTIVTARTYAQRVDLKLGELLLDLGKGTNSAHAEVFPARAMIALANFGGLLVSWRAARADLPPLALMDQIISDVKYQQYLDDGTEEGKDRWDNVMELRRLAGEYQQRPLENFLEDVALVSDQDTMEASASVPTLLTLHAAKGLEFPVVFIVGLNDGTLPHIRSFEEAEAMQEERRLFYVGITRARNRLYLVIPLNRSQYGRAEPAEESRFLKDIPTPLLDAGHPSRSGRRARADTSSRANHWEGAATAHARLLQPRYHPGMRIVHSVYGEGIVLDSSIQDDDEIVDIYFEKFGLKRVAASLAKMDRQFE